MAVDMPLFYRAWVDLQPQVQDHVVKAVRGVVLAAHDESCVECHNADMQQRCPLRAELVKIMEVQMGRVKG